jgi:hypothetical protein
MLHFILEAEVTSLLPTGIRCVVVFGNVETARKNSGGKMSNVLRKKIYGVEYYERKGKWEQFVGRI